MANLMKWSIVLAIEWEPAEQEKEYIVNAILGKYYPNEPVENYVYIPAEELLNKEQKSVAKFLKTNAIYTSFFPCPRLSEIDVEAFILSMMGRIVQAEPYSIEIQLYQEIAFAGYIVFLIPRIENFVISPDVMPSKMMQEKINREKQENDLEKEEWHDFLDDLKSEFDIPMVTEENTNVFMDSKGIQNLTPEEILQKEKRRETMLSNVRNVQFQQKSYKINTNSPEKILISSDDRPLPEKTKTRRIFSSSTENRASETRSLPKFKPTNENTLTKEEIALENMMKNKEAPLDSSAGFSKFSTLDPKTSVNSARAREKTNTRRLKVSLPEMEKENKSMSTDNDPITISDLSPDQIIIDDEIISPEDILSESTIERKEKNELLRLYVHSDVIHPAFKPKKKPWGKIIFLFFLLIITILCIWYPLGGKSYLDPAIQQVQAGYHKIFKWLIHLIQTEEQNMALAFQEIYETVDKQNQVTFSSLLVSYTELHQCFEQYKDSTEGKNILNHANQKRIQWTALLLSLLEKEVQDCWEEKKYQAAMTMIQGCSPFSELQEKQELLLDETQKRALDSLQGTFKEAEKILMKETWKENKNFLTAFEYIKNRTHGQLNDYQIDINEYKKQFVLIFVKKIHATRKYDTGLPYLTKFIQSYPNEALEFHLDYYVSWLLHRHVLRYTTTFKYTNAVKILQKYKIELENYNQTLNTMIEEIKQQERCYDFIWQGIKKYQASKKEIHIDRIPKYKLSMVKGKISQFQKNKAVVEITVTRNYKCHINHLSWHILKQFVEYVDIIPAQELSYMGGLFLLGQNRKKEAEKLFIQADRKQEYQIKMMYFD